jgi:hypothetical protein
LGNPRFCPARAPLERLTMIAFENVRWKDPVYWRMYAAKITYSPQTELRYTGVK